MIFLYLCSVIISSFSGFFSSSASSWSWGIRCGSAACFWGFTPGCRGFISHFLIFSTVIPTSCGCLFTTLGCVSTSGCTRLGANTCLLSTSLSGGCLFLLLFLLGVKFTLFNVFLSEWLILMWGVFLGATGCWLWSGFAPSEIYLILRCGYLLLNLMLLKWGYLNLLRGFFPGSHWFSLYLLSGCGLSRLLKQLFLLLLSFCRRFFLLLLTCGW